MGPAYVFSIDRCSFWFIQVKFAKIFYTETLLKVCYIQDFGLFRVCFIQDFGLFRVCVIQDFDLFRFCFGHVSLYFNIDDCYVDNLICYWINIFNSTIFFLYWICKYSQTCIERSPVRKGKHCLLRQATSLKMFNSYKMFLWQDKKKVTF